ncbi:hypothetical protein XIS1_1480004 [Xenorhabdus innexi]|uniref:Uncharacterized protein n=1 Tax=Xenorhabdus innexi TaxID=290109 RepID=A0A1N6MUA7_9GAMM|nr:hypothetical protein XIS1_1480004 [Xenorhabdus innexi]
MFLNIVEVLLNKLTNQYVNGILYMQFVAVGEPHVKNRNLQTEV